MVETRLSKETAEEILEQYFEYHDIDLDGDDDDVDSSAEEIADRKQLLKTVRTAKRKLVKYIMLGTVEIKIDDECTVTQILHKPIPQGDRITYREVDAKAKVEMGKAGEDNYLGQAYYLLGSLSQLGYPAMLKLKARDIRVAEMLANIFLLSCAP